MLDGLFLHIYLAFASTASYKKLLLLLMLILICIYV